MLPGQKFTLNKLEAVQCKIINITTHLRLSQINIKDPFYVPFEKIVKEKYLEKKYL